MTNIETAPQNTAINEQAGQENAVGGEQPTRTPRAKKSEFSTNALQATKAACKAFEEVNSFDQQTAAQRKLIRETMRKQHEALEAKLSGGPTEDVDALAKALKKANNKLDSMLQNQGKQFTSARSQAEAAIKQLQAMIDEINRQEDGS